MGNPVSISLPCPYLMLVTEPNPNLVEIVAEAVAGGVNIVQWRDKTTSADELGHQAAAMRQSSLPALLVVNGPMTLEAADGRHLASNATLVQFLRHTGDTKLIGASVHSVDEAKQAADQGADYLIAGTIFASQSHPDIMPKGLDFLHVVCAAVSVPVLAIGGVTPERIKGCIAAGATGVAVLSPIMRAENPHHVAQEYRRALDKAWEEIHETNDKR